MQVVVSCPKVQTGKLEAARLLLMKMFPNRKWLELVADTQQKVLVERDKRGAGEKPVLKKYNKETGEYVDKVNPLAPLLSKINTQKVQS